MGTQIIRARALCPHDFDEHLGKWVLLYRYPMSAEQSRYAICRQGYRIALPWHGPNIRHGALRLESWNRLGWSLLTGTVAQMDEGCLGHPHGAFGRGGRGARQQHQAWHSRAGR